MPEPVKKEQHGGLTDRQQVAATIYASVYASVASLTGQHHIAHERAMESAKQALEAVEKNF